MHNSRRKVAIFTGNRAEYGLQYPIIKAVADHPELEYRLLVSGAHLDPHFGRTLEEIQNDGFTIHQEIKIDMQTDTLYATAQAIGTGILSISQALARFNPDILVVYADRFEGFAACISGTQMNVPTAHVEGGDLTEGGALDDSVRHAMTKLSHLHFTTNDNAAERIRKLGEEPWRIFNVGFPALDLIAAGEFASPSELKEKYALMLHNPIILFTQHSVTTEYEQASEQVLPSLSALRILAGEGCQVVITYPNNDAGGRRIITEIERLREEGHKNIQIHKSLGRHDYHGLLNICGRVGRGVCAGNSSSGIKETPALGCPFINIGSRQRGRLRASNVIDVGYNEKEILSGIRQGLFNEEFRLQCANCENPYGKGDAGSKIAEILSRIEINNRLLQKRMTY